MKLAHHVGTESVSPDTAQSAATSKNRHALIASAVGTTIEWYDFFIYGLIGPFIFDKLFFPTLDPVTGTVAVYATFAVGFASRPLGGLVFGHFGDRIGRKSVMLVTLILMGAATAAMGLLPSYQQIGVSAAYLLVILRFIQGFALGGESTAAGLLVIESSAQAKRGFIGAVIQTAGPLGVLLASVSAFFVAQLGEEQMLTWGWRIPFLLSAVLVGIGLYVRLRIEESQAFASQRLRQPHSRLPLVEVIAKHKRAIIVVLLASMTESTFYYLTGIYSLSFVTKTLGLGRGPAATGIMLANLVALATVPLYGALSDRIGRKKVFMAGIIGAVVYLYVFFGMLETRSPGMIVVAIILAVGLIHAPMFAMQTSFYPELFPTRVRFSGVSVGKQFGIVLGGGISPMIAAALIAYNYNNPTIIAIYYSIMAAITFFALALTKDTRQNDINE